MRSDGTPWPILTGGFDRAKHDSLHYNKGLPADLQHEGKDTEGQGVRDSMADPAGKNAPIPHFLNELSRQVPGYSSQKRVDNGYSKNPVNGPALSMVNNQGDRAEKSRLDKSVDPFVKQHGHDRHFPPNAASTIMQDQPPNGPSKKNWQELTVSSQ